MYDCFFLFFFLVFSNSLHERTAVSLNPNNNNNNNTASNDTEIAILAIIFKRDVGANDGIKKKKKSPTLSCFFFFCTYFLAIYQIFSLVKDYQDTDTV